MSRYHPNLQQALLHWFARQGRDLPWRKTYSPYHVWISEIMLQQTQMDRAVKFFNRWMKRFPDIAALARASEDEVLKLWEGLGYYSRAANILKAAHILMKKHRGTLPDDHTALLALPGIGRYTAGAIMSFAFNREYAVVDANVERFFSRLYDLSRPVKEKGAQRFIWRQAKALVPANKAREFNQALMEVGALVCLPRKPDCPSCPVRQHCKAFRLGTVSRRPAPGKSPRTLHIEMASGVLLRNGRVFIQKRPPTGVWANLWEFPGGRVEQGETPENALVREFKEETEFQVDRLEKITTVKHSYTKYRVTQHCFFCRLANHQALPCLHAAQEYQWVLPEELGRFAFPAGHRQLIAAKLDIIRARASHPQ